ncbi:MAG: ABC transporter substrate-binding protein [Acidimicrobiaceae bacterium]|nr:ABC transporter substrate-binding protein [Acidimicrobiaceae bacterium]
MTGLTRRVMRLMMVLAAFALAASACGGGDSDSGSGTASATTAATATTAAAAPAPATTQAQTQVTIAAVEQTTTTQGAVTTTAAPIPPPEGTLRMVEFSPVTSFNPAASQTAQSAYHYPTYDTLTRQRNDLSLEPSLATSWTQPSPNVWRFTVRDDVVFHDGAEFNAQVAVDNMHYHANFQGNPNAATWAAFVDARVVDDTTFEVEFSVPAPQFPLEMSMVMGMMISPNALDGRDLTRDPQGSGPWIWSDADSQAGVTEVYNLNPNYWNPADQGVETVTVTAVPDNNARLNALLTGETDIMSTTRDAQIDAGTEAGNVLISVPNFFAYLIVTDRAGEFDSPLGDERVRRAILLSLDRDAYADAMHFGKADSLGGIYPPAFSQFNVPELDTKYSYDPDEARRLLAEAGYPDGVTIRMPIMPAINPIVEFVVQMLGASGITIELIQINNGELGPGTATAQWGISWFRDLLVHPARDLGKFMGETGRFNAFRLGDLDDLEATLVDALNAPSVEEGYDLYAEVMEGLIDRGVVLPLAHGGQNALYAPYVSGVTLGLNMQAPMPYGVRLNN